MKIEKGKQEPKGNFYFFTMYNVSGNTDKLNLSHFNIRS